MRKLSAAAFVLLLVGLYTWAFVHTVRDRDARHAEEVARLQILIGLAEADREQYAGQLRGCQQDLDTRARSTGAR